MADPWDSFGVLKRSVDERAGELLIGLFSPSNGRVLWTPPQCR